MMKARTTLILGAIVAMALLPIWAPLAAVWLIATRRSLRSAGHEANRMSEA